MRKNILYLFYAATSCCIVFALHEDLSSVLRTNRSNEPQYVFSQINENSAEKRKQEDMDAMRNWAKDFDPSNIRE